MTFDRLRACVNILRGRATAYKASINSNEKVVTISRADFYGPTQIMVSAAAQTIITGCDFKVECKIVQVVAMDPAAAKEFMSKAAQETKGGGPPPPMDPEHPTEEELGRVRTAKEIDEMERGLKEPMPHLTNHLEPDDIEGKVRQSDLDPPPEKESLKFRTVCPNCETVRDIRKPHGCRDDSLISEEEIKAIEEATGFEHVKGDGSGEALPPIPDDGDEEDPSELGPPEY